MDAVRKDRGVPSPRGAAPRAVSRQGEISLRSRPRPPLIPSQSFSASPRPLSTIPAPLREHSLLRASPFAGQQADDDIFVQPQLLHAHAALLLDRTHRGAEHLVAGVFEYYSWMPQVAASSAWPLMHSALGSQQPPAPLLNRADAN